MTHCNLNTFLHIEKSTSLNLKAAQVKNYCYQRLHAMNPENKVIRLNLKQDVIINT